jgi:hypothetical protein
MKSNIKQFTKVSNLKLTIVYSTKERKKGREEERDMLTSQGFPFLQKAPLVLGLTSPSLLNQQQI